MPTTIQTKPQKNNTAKNAKALVVIDFGNGDVKVKAQLPGSAKWANYLFPSHVAEAAQPSKQCLTLITDNGLKNYLVGDVAQDVPCSRTGSTAGRKAEISPALFLHAMRLVFGDVEGEVHCDVIFTAPSVAQYGAEMVSKLQKRHHIQVPRSQYVPGSKAKNYVVAVHAAIPMLEGHLGFAAAGKALKAPIWLFDCGNRTINVTKVDTDGDIITRRPFDACGIHAIADRIVAGELLGERLKTPSTQAVIDYLFSHPDADTLDAVAPALSACVGEALNFVDDDCDRYVIGGGAPIVAGALSATAGKEPRWANVNAIAAQFQAIVEDFS